MTAPARILHIDDNPGDLSLAHAAFEGHPEVVHEPCEEVIGAIGSLATDAIAGRTPDLILLDLRLCGMGGTDVLQLLKANRRLRRVPVIILSASEHPTEREECLRLGAQAFLTKPTSFEGMCQAADELCSLLAHGDAPDALAAPTPPITQEHAS